MLSECRARGHAPLSTEAHTLRCLASRLEVASIIVFLLGGASCTSAATHRLNRLLGGGLLRPERGEKLALLLKPPHLFQNLPPAPLWREVRSHEAK